MAAKCCLCIGLTIKIYDRMAVAAFNWMPPQVHPSNNDVQLHPKEVQNGLFVTIGAETS